MANTNQPRMSNSAVKVFKVLDVLNRNYFHGYTPTEIAEETGFNLSAINSYVNTLIEAGYAERIQETGRIRPGLSKFARIAVQILNAMQTAEQQVAGLKQRMNRG
ncbi:helix-turn-helix domain-containing protein [Methylomonas sp. SURF-1]|uniref:Helix-turn-helix domain-containing protein n=1 Tax=Methylomonas aurea TaxID=2952224 RepID=A0ABT1UIZ0_9GAMM|nr:helix-turn-helix domain-containing protein [Methylomonas sp. SURF-1]MCQ8182206.1 helix-turn-helix domain-containing protein [Methylomonas sp. SURF-1]